MAFDECTPFPSPREDVEKSMELSMRWAAALARAFVERPGQGDLRHRPGRSISRSAAALGGAARRHRLRRLCGRRARDRRGAGDDASRCSTRPCRRCRADRPRYLMGVGKPADLVGAVMRGIDMFDCVLPTRSGRTAQAFTRHGARQSAQRAPCRRPGAARPRLPLPGLHRLQPRLSAPSRALRRDPRRDAADRSTICAIMPI